MKRMLRRLLPAIPLLFSTVLMADDAEIYYGQSVSADPNILFVLDTSLSMECQADAKGDDQQQYHGQGMPNGERQSRLIPGESG